MDPGTGTDSRGRRPKYDPPPRDLFRRRTLVGYSNNVVLPRWRLLRWLLLLRLGYVGSRTTRVSSSTTVLILSSSSSSTAPQEQGNSTIVHVEPTSNDPKTPPESFVFSGRPVKSQQRRVWFDLFLRVRLDFVGFCFHPRPFFGLSVVCLDIRV